MKKVSILAFILCAALSGCSVKKEDVKVEQEEVSAEALEIVIEPQDTTVEETIIEEETYVIEEETYEIEEEAEPLENLYFTVDITDNFVAQSKLLVGNTSTETGYSGVIMIYVSDDLIKDASNVEIGNTYIIETVPLMTMSLPPHVNAVMITKASESDINKLEDIRLQISNFKECMLNYENMELKDIITDANINYATWTQEEIKKYLDFVAEKGYTEDMIPVSYVNLRNNLNGSYLYSE